MAWTLKNNGVIMNGQLIAFMDELAARLPFDVVVTSGVRTPAAQAAAMFTKIELGEDLTKLYKNRQFALDVTAAHPDAAAAAEIIQRYAAAGGGSTHLRGVGIDLRTRDLTTAQRNQLQQAVEDMGSYALYEPTPPHMHIELKKNYTSSSRLPLVAALLIGAILWTM